LTRFGWVAVIVLLVGGATGVAILLHGTGTHADEAASSPAVPAPKAAGTSAGAKSQSPASADDEAEAQAEATPPTKPADEDAGVVAAGSNAPAPPAPPEEPKGTARLSGRVTHEEGGQPAHDVGLRLSPDPQDLTLSAAKARTGRTDSQGEFRLDGVPYGSWILRCEWTDERLQRPCAAEIEPIEIGADPLRVELQLPTPATEVVPVAGVVRDVWGEPLADHVVEISTPPKQAGDWSMRLIDGTGQTAADGSFRATGIAPGTKRVRLLGPGAGDLVATRLLDQLPELPATMPFDPLELDRSLEVPAAGPDRVVLEAPSHRDVLVSGHLVNEAGAPVRSARVESSDGRSIIRSDDQGRLVGRVAATPSPGATLAYQPADAKDTSAEPDQRNFMPVALALERTPLVQDLGQLAVQRMAGLALMLRDRKNGQYVGHAQVRIVLDELGEGLVDTRRAADQGIYLCWTGVASASYTVTANAPGYQEAVASGQLVAGDKAVLLDLAMDRVSTGSGR
jgi:hypothetical protein